jgi:hypothetical protein
MIKKVSVPAAASAQATLTPEPAEPLHAEPTPGEQPSIRDQFAMHAMGAIIMGVVGRGADKSVLVDQCTDDELLGIAYQCADSAMRARAKL